MYAYDQVLFVGDDYARAELHDSTCNYYRILTDKVVKDRTAISLAYLQRHPDRGRIDSLLLPLTYSLRETSNPPDSNS